MMNEPGVSWGPDAPVNLAKKSGKFIATAYNISPPEVIKIFTPNNHQEHSAMMSQLTLWNYGTCDLCPVVKMAMDTEK